MVIYLNKTFRISYSHLVKKISAASPIVIALRAVTQKYIPYFWPTFGWLLRPLIQQKPSKSNVTSLSIFFRRSNHRPKRRVNVLPTRSSPSESPIKLPPCRQHHRSVHICVDPTSGGHPRPVLCPSQTTADGGGGNGQTTVATAMWTAARSMDGSGGGGGGGGRRRQRTSGGTGVMSTQALLALCTLAGIQFPGNNNLGRGKKG